MNETNACSMQHVHEILGSTLIAERCDDLIITVLQLYPVRQYPIWEAMFTG